MQALWLYIKHNQLQDGHEREYINCNRYFRQVSQMPAPLLSQPLPCLLGYFLATASRLLPSLVLEWSTPLCPQGNAEPLVFPPDLQLWPTPFLRDSHEAGGVAAASGPHCHQPCH